MKVILKGVRPYDPELDGDFGGEVIYNRNLLEQVPYPLEIEAEDKYPNVVDLTKYIVDKEYPQSLQIWGLIWFEYEEIKD